MSDCLSSLTLSAPTCSLLELITIGQYYQPILGYHTLVLSEKCIFQYNKNSFNHHFSAVLTHQYQLGFLTLYFLRWQVDNTHQGSCQCIPRPVACQS